MQLSTLDISILVFFLLLIIITGISLTKKASGSIADFFVGGRNLPWWIAGTSMVATTFAADTPLAVTELVGQYGISGNWLWWNMLLGGMLTTFFFARYWRRANILTELELIEMRYGGKPAAFLRGFKSVYLGLFINALVIGWVNVALLSLLQVFFGLERDQAMVYVALAMGIIVIYTSMSGLLGVAITDVIQFVIAMTGCIILAVLVVNSEKVGGITGLKAKLPPWSLEFFPQIGNGSDGVKDIAATMTLSIGAFLAYVSVQWWSSWYPGAEPGGGGYVVQRMLSAKDEKHSIYATLFFQIAHYCIRPWPWILVGLCSIVLYPELTLVDKKLGYVHAMKDFLPPGLKGLLLAAFLAAYMSTISTQLNWGASYLVNDLYKRFIKPGSSEKQLILVSRIVTVLVMIFSLGITTMIETISGVWKFIIECGAGLGLVLILRWYWWRINAWSEITASIAPFIGYALFNYVFEMQFPESFFYTVAFTTICWLAVTFLTTPESEQTLKTFYDKIKPDGNWGVFADNVNSQSDSNHLLKLGACWISSVIMAYSILFMTGKFIFQEWTEGFICMGIALVGFFVLKHFSQSTKIFSD